MKTVVFLFKLSSAVNFQLLIWSECGSLLVLSLLELLINEKSPNAKIINANNPSFSLTCRVALKQVTTKKRYSPMFSSPQNK
jgi:hypothetical protein